MTAATTLPTDAGMERVELPGIVVSRMPEGVWCERNEGGLVPANEVCAAMFDEIVRLRSAAAMSPRAPAQGAGVPDGFKAALQAFIDRKYVARADARQKALGLAYVTAEHTDLADEIDRFVRQQFAASPHQPAAGNGWQSQAARDVLAERRRQVEVEGWTAEHDDRHATGELAVAAGVYVIAASSRFAGVRLSGIVDSLWPFELAEYKPSGLRRDLVKAGALIIAEMDRLDRAAPPSTGTTGTGEASGGEHG